MSRAALLALLALALAACAGPSATPATEEQGRGSPPVADSGAPDGELGAGLRVVATVFPLASVVREIAPAAEVTLLNASGQDPHDLELGPADRALLETADVVVYQGDIDFQPQVEAAIGDAGGEVVAVAEVVGHGALRELDDHDDDDAHDDGDDGGDDGDGEVDPHLWFDATVMGEAAEAVGAALAAADPGDADRYEAAAAAVRAELEALDAELDALLSGCAHDTAIVSHEAYAYLLEPRGLGQEGVSGAGGHGGASPQRLAELTAQIRSEGIPAVLAEPVEGRADAESLAAEADVDLLEIDSLELGDDEAMATGYPALLRAQAEAFAEALRCS